MKKVIMFTVFLMMFQLVSGMVPVFAEGDSTPPVVKSVNISPKEASVGETITFSADIEDDISGVRSVYMAFSSPSNSRDLSLTLRYNDETGLYEATHRVAEADEGGLWKFIYIGAFDQVDNYESYRAYDFENNLDFRIHNEKGDSTPPVVKSVDISPKEASVGETITFSADIEDDISGVRSVYMAFSSPSNSRDLSLTLRYNDETGLYEATHRVGEADERGLWKFTYIGAFDQVDNYESYRAYDFENNLDFIIQSGESDLENTSINDPALPYAVVTKNEAWINKTIDKDLYIGPNSTITIADDVTITGNVYVYGTLITHGGLSIGGTLNAKTVTYGSTSYAAPGAVRIVGWSNSIRSTKVSNQAYPVPFNIYSEGLTNETDTAVIEGKTLPFLDVTMQGNPVSLEADGSFKATAEQVTSDGIQFNLRDVFGNNMKKELAVTDVVPPAAVQNFTVSKTTPTEIQVSWDANSEQDLKGYEVYLNGELADTLPAETLEYTFSKLQEGTAYEVAIAAADFSDNVSKVIETTGTTSLSKPTVNPVSDKATSVTGQAFPGTTVSVEKGDSEIGSSSVNSNGEFNIEIPAQKAGTELYVFAKNKSGIISDRTKITVEDKTPPATPTIKEVTDKSTAVKGSAEAESFVSVKAQGTELGKAKANKDGNFEVSIAKQKAGTKLSVTATDAAGNISTAVETTVSDVTAPEIPTVNQVTHKSTEITGSAEAFGEVSVMKDSEILASGTATANGSYLIAIDPQAVETKLEVFVTDQAGNQSVKASVLVEKALPEETVRISGASRYDTAVAISKKGWKTADTVVLATASDFPDALAGGPLAFQEDAPILLTRTASLTKETKAEIERLGAEKVIILGSKGAVSLEVEAELKQMKVVIERIGGKNRFDTAALIADRLDSAEAVVAYGFNFPDVLSVSSYAAKNGIPILLTRADRLPAETAAALKSTSKTHVIGSIGAVGEAVFNALPNPVRYGGKSRYETGFEVNSKLQMGNEKAFIATGTNFPDALAGSVLAAKNNAPILLVKGDTIPEATAEQLDMYESYVIFGGTGAVGETVREQLNKQLNN
ncbi:cell wall-binding repeat-containing protein [Planococcus sp. ISL-109]|uniref:cell wall-binding repeat-containing protein n=1 Tax=Planococcus sp. ISL-109 TaxID=2819166 RepID=UPI001BE50A5E|nr:cell wall-binding repeat-containing protein [Planococcus sp. ISL-109]MBT2581271.1 cell wall-binding repeat-containing protein [Planococcus sp. ISL-109]